MYIVMLIIVAIVALGYSSNGSSYKKASQFVALVVSTLTVSAIPLIAVAAVVKYVFF